MNIWVDADACPVALKEIMFRAAKRTGIQTVLVANTLIKIPKIRHVRFKKVTAGFDEADKYILESADPGDLVITNDIPLASDCIAKGCLAINTKGELLTAENIGERLNIRDFMDTMRSSGVQTGGSAPLSQRDIQQFSDAFDRQMTKYLNGQKTS